MGKKPKNVEDHLKTVQILLVGLLLKEEPKPDVKKLAKLIGMSDDVITDLYPQRKTKKSRTKASLSKAVENAGKGG